MKNDRPTLKDLVRTHSIASSEREKAEIEDRIRKTSSPALLPRDLQKVLGGSSYEYVVRAHLLLTGLDEAWDKVDKERMSIGAVTSILQRAKRIAKSEGKNLSEAFQEASEWTEKNCFRKTSGGRTYFAKRKAVGVKDAWTTVKAAVRAAVRKELAGVDEALMEKVERDLRADLDILIRRHRSEIRAAARLNKEIAEPATPGEVREACGTLDVRVPKRILDLDMDEVRTRYRRLAFEYHSDRNPGNAHVAKLYIEVNQAYALLTAEYERAKERNDGQKQE